MQDLTCLSEDTQSVILQRGLDFGVNNLTLKASGLPPC